MLAAAEASLLRHWLLLPVKPPEPEPFVPPEPEPLVPPVSARYKFGYGAEPMKRDYLSVRRLDTDPTTAFVSIGTGAALKRIESFLKAGNIDDALRACRQLSKIFN